MFPAKSLGWCFAPLPDVTQAMSESAGTTRGIEGWWRRTLSRLADPSAEPTAGSAELKPARGRGSDGYSAGIRRAARARVISFSIAFTGRVKRARRS